MALYTKMILKSKNYSLCSLLVFHSQTTTNKHSFLSLHFNLLKSIKTPARLSSKIKKFPTADGLFNKQGMTIEASLFLNI